MTSSTRASSERQFYTLLKNVAEALLQLSDGDVADAEAMVHSALRKLEEFMPRFRGLNVAALREDMQRLLGELRESQAGRRAEIAPSRLPRLRVLPARYDAALPGRGGSPGPAARPAAGRAHEQAGRHEPRHPRRAGGRRPILAHRRRGRPPEQEAGSRGPARAYGRSGHRSLRRV